MIYKSAAELIGKTPLMELTHIEEKYSLKAKIFAKLEYFNPAGSVKDRIALGMIENAQNRQRFGYRRTHFGQYGHRYRGGRNG